MEKFSADTTGSRRSPTLPHIALAVKRDHQGGGAGAGEEGSCLHKWPHLWSGLELACPWEAVSNFLCIAYFFYPFLHFLNYLYFNPRVFLLLPSVLSYQSHQCWVLEEGGRKHLCSCSVTVQHHLIMLSYTISTFYATRAQGNLLCHFFLCYPLLPHSDQIAEVQITIPLQPQIYLLHNGHHKTTCSTMDASLPRAKPHSSPLVTTALPSFTTMRLACFSSLRCANDLPCVRLRGTVINGMLLQQRMDSFLRLREWRGRSAVKERKQDPPLNVYLGLPSPLGLVILLPFPRLTAQNR